MSLDLKALAPGRSRHVQSWPWRRTPKPLGDEFAWENGRLVLTVGALALAAVVRLERQAGEADP